MELAAAPRAGSPGVSRHLARQFVSAGANPSARQRQEIDLHHDTRIVTPRDAAGDDNGRGAIEGILAAWMNKLSETQRVSVGP
jgi:hypothetical protein